MHSCVSCPPWLPLGVQGQGMSHRLMLPAPACLPGVPLTASSLSPVTSHATLSPPLRGNTLPLESSSMSPTDPRPHCHCSSCSLQSFQHGLCIYCPLSAAFSPPPAQASILAAPFAGAPLTGSQPCHSLSGCPAWAPKKPALGDQSFFSRCSTLGPGHI